MTEFVDIDKGADRLDPEGLREIGKLGKQLGIQNFLEIPSGQKMNITIELQDAEGSRVKNENVATARIVLETVEVALQGEGGRRNLVLASRGTEVYLQNSEAACVNGTFRFPNLIITQAPGSLKVLKFEISGLDRNGIVKSFVDQPPIQTIRSRSCRAGEE